MAGEALVRGAGLQTRTDWALDPSMVGLQAAAEEYLDPKSTYNNGRKPVNTAQDAIVLHTFRSEVDASASDRSPDYLAMVWEFT